MARSPLRRDLEAPQPRNRSLTKHQPCLPRNRNRQLADRLFSTTGGRRSFPVIGVTGKDGGRAIELLGEHDADELMWPGLGAEGKPQIGSRPQLLVVTVRAAYGYDKVPNASVAKAGEPSADLPRGKIPALLVKQQEGAVAEKIKQPAAFLALALEIRSGTTFGDFSDARKFQADSRSGLGETLQVALGKLPFRAGFQAAHSVNGNANRRLVRFRWPCCGVGPVPTNRRPPASQA